MYFQQQLQLAVLNYILLESFKINPQAATDLCSSPINNSDIASSSCSVFSGFSRSALPMPIFQMTGSNGVVVPMQAVVEGCLQHMADYTELQLPQTDKTGVKTKVASEITQFHSK